MAKGDKTIIGPVQETNPVIETIYSKMHEGDTVLSSYASLQAAVDATPSGKTLIVDTDTTITSPVMVTKPITITGYGFTISINHGGASCFDVHGTNNVRIKGLTFTTIAPYSNSGIAVSNASHHCIFEDNTFIGMYFGVCTNDESVTHNIQILNSRFNSITMNGIGINSSGVYGYVVTGNVFDDCGYDITTIFPNQVKTVTAGIELRGGKNSIISNNVFQNCVNNPDYNDAIRIEWHSESVTYPTGNTVSNNTITNVSGNGIRSIIGHNNLYIGNTISNVSYSVNDLANGNGLFLQSNDTQFPTNETITGNIFKDCPVAISTGASHVEDCIITNNTIFSKTNSVALNRGLIYYSGNKGIIKGNTIFGNDTINAGIFLTGNGSNSVIESNYIENCGGYGGIIVFQNNCIIKYNTVIDNRVTKIHPGGIFISTGYSNTVLIDNYISGYLYTAIYYQDATFGSQGIAQRKVAVPVSKASAGLPGDYAIDANYYYVAVPTGAYSYNWKRIPLIDDAW